jgi:hypothetical protein
MHPPQFNKLNPSISLVSRDSVLPLILTSSYYAGWQLTKQNRAIQQHHEIKNEQKINLISTLIQLYTIIRGRQSILTILYFYVDPTWLDAATRRAACTVQCHCNSFHYDCLDYVPLMGFVE